MSSPRCEAVAVATMSMATYSKYRERARNAQAVSDIGAIQTALANWMVDNQGLPKTLSGSRQDGEFLAAAIGLGWLHL